MSILIILFSLSITGFSLVTFSQETTSPELYISFALTPVNDSTIGVEGPAVDKDGTLYSGILTCRDELYSIYLSQK